LEVLGKVFTFLCTPRGTIHHSFSGIFLSALVLGSLGTSLLYIPVFPFAVEEEPFAAARIDIAEQGELGTGVKYLQGGLHLTA
jgi:hypothetical protein